MRKNQKPAQREVQQVRGVSKTEAIDLIRSSNGKFVTVTFKNKKGFETTVNGRTGVTKGVKGTGKTPNVGAMGYIRLYTNKEGNWRLVDTRTIISGKASGESFKVNS